MLNSSTCSSVLSLSLLTVVGNKLSLIFLNWSGSFTMGNDRNVNIIERSNTNICKLFRSKISAVNSDKSSILL
ncbi:unnamed protein product [Schistosoma mattheei]|uniref:Uncharacterized protein n=1 Tax=Schistosoma mattheei TaxID=31246 RepID=A0A3P8JZP8_9TREM|nr:unnamed protein product [Schistosoma mattheei]